MLRQALEEGGFGLSTGLDYGPERHCPEEEIAEPQWSRKSIAESAEIAVQVRRQETADTAPQPNAVATGRKQLACECERTRCEESGVNSGGVKSAV